MLAPFLFLVYINDLPDNISISTGVGLNADDTKLHRCVKNRNDALALQSDIQSLHCWSNENLLSFNKSKCKVLSITRRKSPLIYPYALGDHQLLSYDVESDLSITISSRSRLLWNVHINKVRSKANKTLGLIRRSTMEITDTNARRLMYLQLERSNFSYATQAWCPQSVKLIEDVEKVQRRSTKYILNLGFITDISYKTRLLQIDDILYYLSHIGTSTWIWCYSTRLLTISHTLTNVLYRLWLDQELQEVNQIKRKPD